MTYRPTISRLATVAVLSIVAASPASAQGFRIGAGGGGWFPGGVSNFGRTSGSLGKQAQGVAESLAGRFANGGRRSGTYLPVSPVAGVSQPQPVGRSARGNYCETDMGTPPSRPVTPTHPVSQPVAATADEQAQQLILAARREFKNKDYRAARTRMDEVVNLVPKNQDARQFRSLILFSMADYQGAAAEAYDSFLMGPAWTWATLRSLYSSASVYTEQFRALQKAANDHPESLETQFLLAYHYLMLGHLKHGEAQLQKVLELRPEEPVTQQLLVAVRAAQNAPQSQTAGN